ncbi:cytochrome b562 [[Haemophilus] ducreyi]|uniref:cytochrome b562 n=1 Tax=Haemophilus ducreyi TaxID=730 RepID=UPI0006559AEA|nr:cytochrome b562 [[Haemophilus] ducreyi]AKO46426.1 cytochrome B562 [[Haemophilus] ducreyi]AKO47770.1 cytochrome B562 [[Haemophilus] ducreyi]AKO49154.1 cytochrome B562 [[Haemophilus] ducreyi]ANF62215.1 cytochrome B562 [[Haemophilus] ducreyi]ANF67155.1 cytochrome B562 [[Haemophilus] ducreyi]
MNKLRAILATSLLSFSTIAFSNGVMMEMFQMNKQLKSLEQAQTSKDFETIATDFLLVARKAKETMPASLQDDQERFKGYQAGIQDIIDQVKKAKELAEQDKFVDAKELVEQLHDLKKKYHLEYK